MTNDNTSAAEDINKNFVLTAINENFINIVDKNDNEAVSFNVFVLTPKQAEEAQRNCYEIGMKASSSVRRF